jgi:hypothetical protein
MSVYGYSINKGKVSFNIHLSSYQVNSWTGSLYNATYSVEPRGHLDVGDYYKQYNISISLQSEALSDGTIDPAKTYVIHFDIGGNTPNSIAYRERSIPHFIAYQNQYNNLGGTLFSKFNIGSQDNPPIRVNSLIGFNSVSINIFDINGQTTCASIANYQVILRFEEV